MSGLGASSRVLGNRVGLEGTSWVLGGIKSGLGSIASGLGASSWVLGGIEFGLEHRVGSWGGSIPARTFLI